MISLTSSLSRLDPRTVQSVASAIRARYLTAKILFFEKNLFHTKPLKGSNYHELIVGKINIRMNYNFISMF